MRHKNIYNYILLGLVFGLILNSAYGIARAEGTNSRRPIDMMILIDNSCSMFPANQIRANCDSYGSDVNFLRITGADLFLARLGFGDPNEANYQLGLIEVGDEPGLVAPLQPIIDTRDTIAGKIAHPLAQPATRIVPAIQKAYTELKSSSKKDQNVPALVLITDGVPWPREGQGNKDIETLITANPNVPLFIMLLENKTRPSKDYDDYIKFWEDLQTRTSNIFVYPIGDANQIEETFNQILGQLQNTVPSDGIDIGPSKPYKYFVNQYIQKLIITVVRKNNAAGDSLTILDPSGAAVKADEPGVKHFRGKENPIEVFSLSSPRIADSLKGKNWTISSTSAVKVFIDREGAYQFNYISPTTQAGDIANVYQAIERQTPSKDFIVHFNLLDPNGKPVLEPQTIQGSVINPTGGVVELPTLGIIRPDSSGLYEFKYDLKSAFPNIINQTGRYVFIFNAGITDNETKDFISVTSSRLIVDVGLVPYIRSIAPLPVVCESSQPFDLRVNIGDYSTASQDSLKVSVLSGASSIILESKDSGSYGSDITSFCAQMIAQLSCADSRTVDLTIQLDANGQDGNPLPPVKKDVTAQIVSPKCTSTPIPTATYTPAPTPTPTPDLGLIQTCSGIRGLPSAGSCLPWNFVYWSTGIVFALLVSTVWVWPWVKVRTVSEPPTGFLIICQDGKPVSKVISLHEIGRAKRTNIIKVGSGRGAQIHIPGLKSVELIIERKNVVTSIREPDRKEPFAYLDLPAKIIRTSSPKITLKVSTDKENLSC